MTSDRPLRPDPIPPIHEGPTSPMPDPTEGKEAAPERAASNSAGIASSQAEDFANRLLEAQIVSNDQPLNLRHVGGARFLVQTLITFLVLGYCGWQLARDKNPDKTIYSATATTIMAWWISSPGSRR